MTLLFMPSLLFEAVTPKFFINLSYSTLRVARMCWGSPAVVVEAEGSIAKVDYGDGIIREVFVGISEGRVEPGDLVMVHAGVIITKLTPEGVVEQIEFIKSVVGEEASAWVSMYENILKLAEELKRKSV